jgi:hypothetical protein
MTLRPALLALCALLAAPAIASGDEMTANYRDSLGTPLHPGDVAGEPWTLSTQGHAVCAVRFGTEQGEGGVYRTRIGRDCGQALPAGIVGWKPVTDGLALVGADASAILDFNQVTPTDLVATRAGAPFLELKRP